MSGPVPGPRAPLMAPKRHCRDRRAAVAALWVALGALGSPTNVARNARDRDQQDRWRCVGATSTVPPPTTPPRSGTQPPARSNSGVGKRSRHSSWTAQLTDRSPTASISVVARAPAMPRSCAPSAFGQGPARPICPMRPCRAEREPPRSRRPCRARLAFGRRRRPR